MIKLIQKGFNPDGDLGQLRKFLPDLADEYPYETLKKVARRCIKGAFKRRGTIVLTREQLGLPSIKKIDLY